VFDIETTYGTSKGRTANRWDTDFGLCSVGWKFGKGEYDDAYTVTRTVDGRFGRRPDVGLPFPDLSDINYLIGHNVKFDLTWYWDHPEIIKFITKGGKIWDTMYAEYLLSAQFYNFHNNNPGMGLSLSDVAKRRECKYQKLDVVRAMWDSGVRTEDVPENVLLEYNKYDVLTTEEIFLDQLKQARKEDQTVQIQQRMEGLLATTEMEYNGMFIDQEVAAIQQEDLEQQIQILEIDLDEHVPPLPDGCEFKWSSFRNKSALLFGGLIKYEGREYSLDFHGHKQYYQRKVRRPVLDTEGNKQYFKGGKNKGALKTRLETEPDIERGAKMRNCDLYVQLPGLCEPDPQWATSVQGYYSTDDTTMTELADRGITLAKDITKLTSLTKDLGTYYKRFNKGKWTGMLTNIQDDGCVHGQLNHSVTVTTRLSSSNPNLQNIPKKGKSLIKKTFRSRFPDGVVAEIDYAQLEVVCKGVLSGDEVLLEALQNNLDEHCEWLSFVAGVTYEEAYDLCKVQHNETWLKKRQEVKPITFGEKYGAGVEKLSQDSGIPPDQIRQAMDRRQEKYPKLYAFDDEVTDQCLMSRQVTRLRTDEGYQKSIGYYRSPTNTIFHFLENESLPWQQKKGVMTSFSPTCIKNYPSQGLGGEIMQVQSGRVLRALFREELQNDVLLINTVHDSIYIDIRTEELAKKWLPRIAGVLEDVSMYFNLLHTNVAWDTPFPVDVDYGLNIMETTNTITERNKEWIS